MAYSPRHKTELSATAPNKALWNTADGIRRAKASPKDCPTISPGNVKTGLIPSVSLPPVWSCPNCAECKKDCYVLRNMLQGLHAKDIALSYGRNWELWRRDPVAYFSGIRKHLTTKAPQLFRWHVSGDIPSGEYWRAMVVLAQEFPDTRFLVFSKAYTRKGGAGLPFGQAPGNLSVILSCWPGQELPNNSTLPRAYLETDTRRNRRRRKALWCPGNCETCAACWGAKGAGIDVYFPLH